MPNSNNLNASSHQYGFNGQMNDNEVHGSGNSLDFGARIYNPRLGKFLSRDPLTKTYSMLTPYQFAGNTPIQAIDLDGLEGVNIVNHTNYTTTVKLTILHVTGDGFNNDAIQKMVNKELSKKRFKDNRFKQPNGQGYEVKFNIMFKEIATLEEAKQIQENNPMTTVRLIHDVDSDPLIGASTGPGQIWIHPSKGPHTFTHEIFHSFISFGDNAPEDIFDERNEKGKTFAHSEAAKYGGGILSYGYPMQDVSDKNVKLAIEHTSTFEISNLQKIKSISPLPAIRAIINIKPVPSQVKAIKKFFKFSPKFY